MISTQATLVTRSSGGGGSGFSFATALFNRGLFQAPASPSAGACWPEYDLAGAPPLCKNRFTRGVAFETLTSVCDGIGTEGWDQVGRQILARHPLETGVSAVSLEEEYGPTQVEVAPHGYVGMRNLGCICYMNSTNQQLFMVPSFRRALLAAPDCSESETDDDVLFQMQLMMAYLQESELQFYDPVGLCRALKDWDGNSVNVAVQQDASEYLQQIFQALETALGTAPDGALKIAFGGLTSSELVATSRVVAEGTKLNSERIEPFYFITVQVKSQGDLETALREYIKGEEVDFTWEVESSSTTTPTSKETAVEENEDDDVEGNGEGGGGEGGGVKKQHVQKTTKTEKEEIPTTKRSSIRQLPEHLIIHLKRFEFDYTKMTQLKVNDSFAFPRTLDMRPYTAEGAFPDGAGVEAQQQLKSEIDAVETDMEMNARLGYTYRLGGVVVHRGGANSGHYYSYIRTRDGGGHFSESAVPSPASAVDGDAKSTSTTAAAADDSSSPEIVDPPLLPSSPQLELWHEFNDTAVREFDPSNLESACFGGMREVQRKNKYGRLVNVVEPKTNSAFLLVYDRVPPFTSAAASASTSGGKSAEAAALDASAAATASSSTDITHGSSSPTHGGGSTTASSLKGVDERLDAAAASLSMDERSALLRTQQLVHRAHVSPRIFKQLCDQNIASRQRRSTYDNSYFDFVEGLVFPRVAVAIATTTTSPLLELDAARKTASLDDAKTSGSGSGSGSESAALPSPPHALLSLQIGVQMVLTTLANCQNTSRGVRWSTQIAELLRASPEGSAWLLNSMAMGETLVYHVLQTGSKAIREATATMVGAALATVAAMDACVALLTQVSNDAGFGCEIECPTGTTESGSVGALSSAAMQPPIAAHSSLQPDLSALRAAGDSTDADVVHAAANDAAADDALRIIDLLIAGFAHVQGLCPQSSCFWKIFIAFAAVGPVQRRYLASRRCELPTRIIHLLLLSAEDPTAAAAAATAAASSSSSAKAAGSSTGSAQSKITRSDLSEAICLLSTVLNVYVMPHKSLHDADVPKARRMSLKSKKGRRLSGSGTSPAKTSSPSKASSSSNSGNPGSGRETLAKLALPVAVTQMLCSRRMLHALSLQLERARSHRRSVDYRRVTARVRDLLIFTYFGRCIPRDVVVQTWEPQPPSMGADTTISGAARSAASASAPGTPPLELTEEEVLSQPFVSLLAVTRSRKPNYLRLKPHWQCLRSLFAIDDQYRKRRIDIGLALVWEALQGETKVYRWFENVRI